MTEDAQSSPTALSETQRRWVEQTTDRVEALARSLAPRMPHVSHDELRSVGFEALVTAALRYDPSAGVPFGAFAYYRVRGAMIDAARRAAPALRRRSRAQRALETTQSLLEQASKRQPSPHVPDPRSLEQRVQSAADLVAQATVAVLLSKVGPADPDTVTDDIGDLEQRFLDGEQRELLRVSIEQGSAEERALLDALYFRGLSMNEYASEIGKSKSYVSRHHARALERLSKRMRRAEG